MEKNIWLDKREKILTKKLVDLNNDMNKITNEYEEYQRQIELKNIEREIKSLEIRIKEFKEIRGRLKTKSAIKLIENSIKEMEKLKRKRNRMIPRVVAEMI